MVSYALFKAAVSVAPLFATSLIAGETSIFQATYSEGQMNALVVAVIVFSDFRTSDFQSTQDRKRQETSEAIPAKTTELMHGLQAIPGAIARHSAVQRTAQTAGRPSARQPSRQLWQAYCDRQWPLRRRSGVQHYRNVRASLTKACFPKNQVGEDVRSEGIN
jgi:hypothetical protein